jgi:hypothetical protein
VLCPRCVDAVQVAMEFTGPGKIALRCKKCIHYRHKNGSFIKEVTYEGLKNHKSKAPVSPVSEIGPKMALSFS